MKKTTLILSLSALLCTGAASAGTMQKEDIWNKLDADADGQITTAELDLIRAERFNKADLDGDGQLTLAEMKERIPPGPMRFFLARIATRVFNALDADNNDVVTFDEIEAQPYHLMDKKDTNNDGVITPDEFVCKPRA